MRDRPHPLGAVALAAQLAVVDHLVQPGHPRFQRLLAVLVEEELGVGQARAHHPLVALHHRTGVVGPDVADDQELVGQLAGGVQQRKVLLVGLHRQDQAFLRHAEEFRLELADQHVRPLDQGRHLVQQGIVVDRLQAFLGRRGGQLAHDLGAARGEAGDHRAFVGQLLRIAVGVAQRHLGLRGLEAVAQGHPAGLQAQGGDRHHIGAMQRHQAVRRTHEVHAVPARVGAALFQLVGHHLGNGQPGQCRVQRLLQALGQRGAGHGAVQEQGLGLAVGPHA